MSELLNLATSRDFRWNLLATVSSLTLITALSASPDDAHADEGSRPIAWIELGGQIERLSDGLEPLNPPFAATIESAEKICDIARDPCGIPAGFTSPSVLQRTPRFGFGGEASISLEPAGSDWNFSASIRYGRSNGNKHVHQQTSQLQYQIKYHLGYPSRPPRFLSPNNHLFSDVVVRHDQSYSIVDFSAGKDVGLGLFDRKGTSVINAGVRFAQFSSRSHVELNADPDLYYPGSYLKYSRHHHSYSATESATRSVSVVGPSLRWNASVPVAGESDSSELTVDWGINAAVLFGRQHSKGVHATNGYYFTSRRGQNLHVLISQYSTSASHDRRRSVIIPNVGGFAGLSLKFPDARVSLGYRGDFFFGAIDGGLNTRKSSTLGFYGPFATISIGLGG